MSAETIEVTTQNTDTDQQLEVYGASTDEINRELLGKSGGLRTKVSDLLRQAKDSIDGAVTNARNKITGVNLLLQNKLLERYRGALERKTARHNVFSHQQQESFDKWKVAAQNKLVADEDLSQQKIDETRFGILRNIRQTAHNNNFSARLQSLDDEVVAKKSAIEESIASSQAGVDGASIRVGAREDVLKSKQDLIDQRTADFEARKAARLNVDIETKNSLLGRAEAAQARKAMREALKQDGATRDEVREILAHEFSKEDLTALGRQAAAIGATERAFTRAARQIKSSESSLGRAEAALKQISKQREERIADIETTKQKLAELQTKEAEARDLLRNTDKTLDDGNSNPEYSTLRDTVLGISAEMLDLEINIESMQRDVDVTLPRRSGELKAKMVEIRESIDRQSRVAQERKIRSSLARISLGLHLDSVLA